MATELTHALQLDLLSISDRSRRTCRCIWTLKHTQKPSSHVWRAHIGKELPTSKSISLSRNSMLFTIPFSQWSSGRCFHVSYGLSILQIYFYSSWEKQLNKKKTNPNLSRFLQVCCYSHSSDFSICDLFQTIWNCTQFYNRK